MEPESTRLLKELLTRMHAFEYSLTSLLYLITGDGGNSRTEEWCMPGQFLCKYDRVTETLEVTTPENENRALTVLVNRVQLHRGYVRIKEVGYDQVQKRRIVTDEWKPPKVRSNPSSGTKTSPERRSG